MIENLRHLTYVLAAADKGSITEAASELGVSQPAVSAAIKSFEERFGYRIFVRNPARGLSLTPPGRAFVKQARRLLQDARDFDRGAMGLGQEIAGEIQVGCYFITAPFIMPPILAALAGKYPSIGFNLHEGDLVEVANDLRSGATDVALTYDTYADSGIEFEGLFQTPPHVLLSANDPLVEQEAVSLRDLVEMPMVLLDLPVSRETFLNFFRMHGLQPRIRFRPKSFEMVRSLVGAGFGFSFAYLRLKSEQSYQGNRLVRRRIVEKLPPSRVCLAVPRNSRPTRITRAFSEVCRQVYHEAETI